MEVRLIEGGKHEDARGSLRFCNDFDLTPVKRFYTISNSASEPKRGWIMHKQETKWFFPLVGVTKIKIESDIHSTPTPILYNLDAEHPRVLCVPPGNWFLIEQDGSAEVQVFSNCFVGEFPNDDFRRPL